MWIGNTTNWNVSSNWSNGLPNTFKTTSIGNAGLSPELNSDQSISTLLVENNASLTINTLSTLAVNGSLLSPAGDNAIKGHIIMRNGGCGSDEINSVNPILIDALEIDHMSSISNNGSMINIVDKLVLTDGVLNTNANLTLLSSPIKTAYLDKVTNGSVNGGITVQRWVCLLYTSPSPRDKRQSRMPSSA